ncbi:hypothetical protein VTK26DRAFT_4547 [Humicola hyalothermophila]
MGHSQVIAPGPGRPRGPQRRVLLLLRGSVHDEWSEQIHTVLRRTLLSFHVSHGELHPVGLGYRLFCWLITQHSFSTKRAVIRRTMVQRVSCVVRPRYRAEIEDRANDPLGLRSLQSGSKSSDETSKSLEGTVQPARAPSSVPSAQGCKYTTEMPSGPACTFLLQISLWIT